MKQSFGKRCALAVGVAALTGWVSLSQAQVSLTVTKSGDNEDIVLSWSGGTGNYDVVRSLSTKMTSETTFLAQGFGDAEYIDSGAAADAALLYCYVVSDAADEPLLTISAPCGTPSCSVTTNQATVAVNGTTDAGVVYVNDEALTVEARSVTAGAYSNFPWGTPLFLGENTVTAAAKNANQNWSFVQAFVTRFTGNQAPIIGITVSDRGAAGIQADGAVIYDPTPQITVSYSDPDGTALNASKLLIYINGTDMTLSFTLGATEASYQVPPGGAWTAGPNFIYASVMDGPAAPAPGYASSTAAHVVLRNPRIDSFTPGPAGNVGDAITINGAGFDPTAGNNMVTFTGAPGAVVPSAATRFTLNVTVPPDARTGDVVVTVDSRASAGKLYQVNMASGFSDIYAVGVNAQVSNHVFFTEHGADALYEVTGSGPPVARCAVNNPMGLAVAPNGDVYYGRDDSHPNPLNVYHPGGACDTFIANTETSGQSSASVASIVVAGSNLYVDDYSNTRIKRISGGSATVIANDGTAQFAGMAGNAAGDTIYFSEFGNIYRLPVPAGGSATLVKTDPAGRVFGLAMIEDKLVAARLDAGKVSWLDPNGDANFYDLAAGLSSPRGVAIGSDTGGEKFVVVAEPTRVFRLPRPSVVVTDDAGVALPSKLVIDFNDPAKDCTEANPITLKVKFNPGTLIPLTSPPQMVTWTVEDPDDPSNDSTIDPSGAAGNDNLIRELPGYPYTQWEQVPGFTLTGSAESDSVMTPIVLDGDGTTTVSRVRFRPSCHPGDNYVFKATVSVPVYGAVTGASGTVTVWRRLHIERDSMGLAVGPFMCGPEPNPTPHTECDAVMGDVPDPALDFLVAAFKPAYVDVVLPTDTGEDTPNVKFQYNVPGTNAAIVAQARLNHGTIANGTASTAGRWISYAQGAYEGDIGKDFDPSNEGDGDLGITISGQSFTLIFFETIRDGAAIIGSDEEYDRSVVPAHEVAHQFGISHQTSTCGLMKSSIPITSPLFCPLDIRRIRLNTVPSFP